MEMIRRTAVGIALILAPLALGQAFIGADRDCGTVTLHVTRGTAFPKHGEAIDATSVSEAFAFLPREKVAITPAKGRRALMFSTNVPDDGVVIASVEFK